MANSLFRTKKIESILSQGSDDHHGGDGLKRVLNVRDLTFFGIAAILGAGSFSSLGGAVFHGGPGVVLLFVITAIACGFTAFCYSEFASRIPVAGSAYTYAYASFGELFAWIIGWALIMEYSIGIFTWLIAGAIILRRSLIKRVFTFLNISVRVIWKLNTQSKEAAQTPMSWEPGTMRRSSAD
jgi:amino acid transporter